MQSVDETDIAYAPQIPSIAELLADYDRTSSHLLPILEHDAQNKGTRL